MKLPCRCPRSISERRRSASTASKHLGTRERRRQHREQLLDGHRLAQDGQPQQHRLLGCREASELLVQQLAHTTKDHLALLQERRDLAPEQLHDGLRHDFEGQRIAHVQLDQPLPFGRSARDVLLRQQLRTGYGIQSVQAQGAYRHPTAFQGHEVARFLA